MARELKGNQKRACIQPEEPSKESAVKTSKSTGWDGVSVWFNRISMPQGPWGGRAHLDSSVVLFPFSCVALGKRLSGLRSCICKIEMIPSSKSYCGDELAYARGLALCSFSIKIGSSLSLCLCPLIYSSVLAVTLLDDLALVLVTYLWGSTPVLFPYIPALAWVPASCCEPTNQFSGYGREPSIYLCASWYADRQSNRDCVRT